MAEPFRVAITRDLILNADLELEVLRADGHVKVEFLPQLAPVVNPDQLHDLDAVISFSPQWTRDTLSGAERLTAVLRMGVGFDQVDVAACTDADVVVCTTAGATSHSMAEAAVTWMLALGHRVLDKHRLMEEGRWDE